MSVTNTFRNPVLPGFNPDPSITYVEGKGYFLCTSTFEFFPGLPIYHSTDLVNWKLIGHALNRRSQGVDMRTVETSAGLWAPTIRYNNGRWYVACTCFYRMRIDSGSPELIPPTGFYVSTDDIFDDTKWTDATYLEEQGFDQDLLFDDDGRVYLTNTRFHFDDGGMSSMKIISYSNEIDIKTGRSLNAPVYTISSDLGTAEGCHLYKIDGWYYLFSAVGGTQNHHQEWVYRSANPLGPYEAPPAGINPILFNAEDPEIQNTGHMDFVKGDGEKWWAVFLGVRPQFDSVKIGKSEATTMTSHLGRETFMAPMEWKDGWPVINNKKPIRMVGEAEGLTMTEEPGNWSDEFEGDELSLGWYSIRTPWKKSYSLTERPSSLALRGSAYRLEQEESPAVLLRKQPAFDLDFTTELEFDASKPGQEAGVVAWLATTMYGAVMLRGTEGGREMVFRGPGADGKFADKTFPISTSSVTLIIKARAAQYDFYFVPSGSTEEIHAGTVKSEVFKPLFTGMQLGVFAQGKEGDQSPCLNSAFFKYAKMSLPQ